MVEKINRFRVWDRKTKKFISIGFHLLGEVTMFNVIDEYVFETKNENEPSLTRYDDLVENQFIGIQDRNGHDIYEGDIIRFNTTEGTTLTHQIWFSKELLCFMVGPIPYSKLYDSAFIQPSKLECDVIGNVYQNPELLKQIE